LTLAGIVVLFLPTPSGAGLPRPDHVVIVVEENSDFEEIIGAAEAPYLNSLAEAGALFTNSHEIERPSQPNYLDLFSGSNQGVENDSCPNDFCTPNLATSLIEAGFTFAGYAEDLPEVGSTTCYEGYYARKHCPWVNFSNVPAQLSLPFTSWPADFTQLPTLSFVIPNQEHDVHDGTLNQADTWLKENLDAYRQWAMSNNSLLIVTWDEAYHTDRIPTIFIGAMVRPGRYDEPIDHFDVLRTLEDIYGLAALGESRNATPITNVWTSARPGLDCNRNGIDDDQDIRTGISKDENEDAIPDECQPMPGRVELVRTKPGCVQVVVETDLAIRGGEFGIGYDARAVVPTSVMPGAHLPSSATIRFDPGPANNCSPTGAVSGGFTVGWTNSTTEGRLIQPGRHIVLQICFDLPPGKFRPVTRDLYFLDCLGACGTPLRNVVMDSSGEPRPFLTIPGEVKIPAKPTFRRGDASEDGLFDLLDVIVSLNCQFLGEGCPVCRTGMDANDDETLDVSDPIYSLIWQFLGGLPPPPPFPDCGPDATAGFLAACEQPESCP